MESKLASTSLFSGLSTAELQAVSKDAITRSYPKNTVIISEGDTTDSLYIILSGKVKIFVSDENGREMVINIQKEGEFLGELALLDELPRSASVMTLEPSKFSVIPKKSIEQCLLEHPSITLKLLKAQIKRVRALTDSIKSLALMDVYGRVAKLLLDMATEENDGLIIKQKPTHQEIANLVGASREMVSRIMKDLAVGGYIKIESGHITVNEKLPEAW